MKRLPTKLNIYLGILYCCTLYLFFRFFSIGYINLENIDYKVMLFFGFLMILTESFTVEFGAISVSTSAAVTIAVFLLQGPLVTLGVVVIGYCFRFVKLDEEYIHLLNTKPYINLFNICILTLPILIGNYVYVSLNGEYGNINFMSHVLPVTLFSVIIFLMNVILLGIFFALRANDGKSIFYYVASNIKIGALNLLAMAPLGLLAAYIFKIASYGGVLLFIFPLMLARFTFSQYIEAKTKYIQTVDVIMRAMEARDRYTEGHSKRVADISCMIAKELKYNEWKIEEINIAALLHDVGKIGIDDSILNKPDKLTNEEFDIIKKHPEIGFNIVNEIKDIENVKMIVRHHHERYDGKGYPDGKKPGELGLDVFIVQLADSIDAMETDRPYRRAMNKEEIMNEVIRCKGTQFHPDAVDAYVKLMDKKKNQKEV